MVGTKYSAIFIDFFMPIMSGEELVKNIIKLIEKHKIQYIPLVCMSANNIDNFIELSFTH